MVASATGDAAPLAVGYSVGVWLVLWEKLADTPPTLDRPLLWTSGVDWAITMALLAIIRLLVLHCLVRLLQHRADYDALTGVRRPGVFWHRAEQVTHQLTRSGKLWAFVYCDLDDFKQINDTAGHLTGDAVLRIFGTLLKGHARQNDVVGRLGGEEFGWVLGGCTTEEAVTAANRLLAAFRAAHYDGMAGFSFSAGVAGWIGEEPIPASVWDVARQADHALYQAKTQGKGRVAVG